MLDLLVAHRALYILIYQAMHHVLLIDRRKNLLSVDVFLEAVAVAATHKSYWLSSSSIFVCLRSRDDLQSRFTSFWTLIRFLPDEELVERHRLCIEQMNGSFYIYNFLLKYYNI